MICTKKLEILASIKETSKFKSGCFDDNNAFIYSTASHVKYLYTSSNTNGVLLSLDDPVYMAYFKNSHLFWINREGEVETKPVNAIEYDFKIALKNRKLNDVIRILKSN